jgi:hypothetical protein
MFPLNYLATGINRSTGGQAVISLPDNEPDVPAPAHHDARLWAVRAVASRYQSIEQRKSIMLRYLETLTDEERRKNPTPAEWSPLQILEHLVLLEELSLGADLPANAKILPKAYLFVTLGGGLTRVGAVSGLRIPTLPAFEPRGEHDFSVIKKRWGKARKTLSGRLASVKQPKRPFIMHAVAGPMSANQFLELLDVHLAYHWRHFPRVRLER